MIRVHYTELFRQLEKVLHGRFQGQRLKASEWFSLSEDDIDFLSQETNVLISHFPETIIENDQIDDFPEPKEDELEDYDYEEELEEELEEEIEEEPIRLRRVPDGEEISEEDMPSLDDEFNYGLVPELLGLYENLGTWQAVGNQYGIPKEKAWAMATQGFQPFADNELRWKLGLSGLIEVWPEMPNDLE